jgi:hypothetical protein
MRGRLFWIRLPRTSRALFDRYSERGEEGVERDVVYSVGPLTHFPRHVYPRTLCYRPNEFLFPQPESIGGIELSTQAPPKRTHDVVKTAAAL